MFQVASKYFWGNQCQFRIGRFYEKAKPVFYYTRDVYELIPTILMNPLMIVGHLTRNTVAMFVLAECQWLVEKNLEENCRIVTYGRESEVRILPLATSAALLPLSL